MTHFRTFLSLTAMTMLVPGAATAQPAPQPTGPAQPLEYAAKFVCGVASGENGRYPMMADGNYFTAVNIHNPGPRRVQVSYKIALAWIREPGPMTTFSNIALNYDQAIDFDCSWIRRQLDGQWGEQRPPQFFTGFLVLQIPRGRALDVVAVYSAGADRVMTMHTERVPVRRVN